MNVLAASLCCLLLAALAAGASLGDARGKLRITDGTVAAVGDLPYQVALLKDGALLCSGTILSADWVLTAASCIDGQTGELEVRAGVVRLDDSNAQTRTTTAADRTAHPQFEPLFLDNDIALIKLSAPLTLDASSVMAADLPTYADAAAALTARRLSISGWGKTSDTGASSNPLRYAYVSLTTNSVCEKEYGNKVIGTKLCLDTASQGSPCAGDVGAPAVETLMRKQFLHGIASFGFEASCQSSKPAVFTRVSSFLEWIGAATGIAIKDN